MITRAAALQPPMIIENMTMQKLEAIRNGTQIPLDEELFALAEYGARVAVTIREVALMKTTKPSALIYVGEDGIIGVRKYQSDLENGNQEYYRPSDENHIQVSREIIE